jgi:hypothetical protein
VKLLPQEAVHMRCLAHSAEAIGICIYCGRGVCQECVGDSERLTCSAACAEQFAKLTVQTAGQLKAGKANIAATVLACYLSGPLFIISGIAGGAYLRSPVLFVFSTILGAALLVMGWFYARAAKEMPPS